MYINRHGISPDPQPVFCSPLHLSGFCSVKFQHFVVSRKGLELGVWRYRWKGNADGFGDATIRASGIEPWRGWLVGMGWEEVGWLGWDCWWFLFCCCLWKKIWRTCFFGLVDFLGVLGHGWVLFAFFKGISNVMNWEFDGNPMTRRGKDLFHRGLSMWWFLIGKQTESF